MDQAAKVGSYPNKHSEKSKAQCQSDFGDFVYNYFDSRYTQELRDSLYEYDIALVWRYIDKVKGEPDPVKHLRGSCDRLMVDNPNNAALLLLRAYTRILLVYNAADIEKDLERGFELFKKQMDHIEIVKAGSRFYREIEKQGDEKLPAIRGQMIKLHLEWLKEFNHKLERE